MSAALNKVHARAAQAQKAERLFYDVVAFDRYGIELHYSLHRSLTSAYRKREELLRSCPCVVVTQFASGLLEESYGGTR